MKPNPEKRYVAGIDAARSGEDSSVVIVIELGDSEKKIPHKVVFIKEIKKNTIDVLYEYVLWLHSKFNFQSIYVDSTGLGSGLADFLIKELNSPKYQKFKRPGYNFKYRATDIVKAITFTIRTKADIFSHMRILMERGMLQFPNNKKLLWQLRSFQYEMTDAGQIKLHHPDLHGARDDYVDALALACQGTRDEGGSCFVWVENKPL